jgi:hypothetical protein
MEHHCQNEVNPKEVKTKFEIHPEIFWNKGNSDS